jgi:hypothetical protein
MKHKTSELTGTLLDAAVAKADGRQIDEMNRVWASVAWQITRGATDEAKEAAHGMVFDHYAPSEDWSLGGKIIERERIGLWAGEEPHHGVPAPKDWFAEVAGPRYPGEFKGRGPTPLVAAMRAYVASKLGDEVELP